MANQAQLAPQPVVAPAGGSQIVSETESVRSAPVPSSETGMSITGPALRLPVEIDVAVPIRSFRVRDLLTLSSGTVIAAQWIQGDDLPLAGPGAQLAWTEFEVIEHKLAVRITRLV